MELLEEEVSYLYMDDIDVISDEAKRMVKDSMMLLIPNWDLEEIFMLDQIKRQDDLMFADEFEGVRGVRSNMYNPNIKSLD